MKYLLTHRKVSGSIKLGYDDQGRVNSFAFDCELSEELWEWFTDNFPFFEKELKANLYCNFTITPVPEDITFDAFWEAYNYKVGNKTRAQKLYKMLNDTERTRVMASIKKYNSYMVQHPAQERCYPETYLNQRRWESSF